MSLEVVVVRLRKERDRYRTLRHRMEKLRDAWATKVEIQAWRNALRSIASALVVASFAVIEIENHRQRATGVFEGHHDAVASLLVGFSAVLVWRFIVWAKLWDKLPKTVEVETQQANWFVEPEPELILNYKSNGDISSIIGDDDTEDAILRLMMAADD